jgi:hypothetical protein
MTNRILDISERPAALSVRHRQLLVRFPGEDICVPLEDIGVLVVPQYVVAGDV